MVIIITGASPKMAALEFQKLTTVKDWSAFVEMVALVTVFLEATRVHVLRDLQASSAK